MIAQLSDGTLHDVADNVAAVALAASAGMTLDCLYIEGETIPIPVELVKRMDAERGPGTSHEDRNTTVGLMLTHLPGRS